MGKKIIECYANKISLSGPMSQSQTITKHGPNTKTCKFGQEIVQSYTTDQNTAPQGRGTELRQPRDSKNNHVRNYNKHWTNNSAVGNVSGNRCESGCISRDREFDPGPVPYFRGNFIMNSFLRSLSSLPLNHSRITSESMCTKYWLTACSSLPRKKVWLGELTVPPWPQLLTLDVKQPNKHNNNSIPVFKQTAADST